jgi:AcrR family transcriptional regulator
VLRDEEAEGVGSHGQGTADQAGARNAGRRPGGRRTGFGDQGLPSWHAAADGAAGIGYSDHYTMVPRTGNASGRILDAAIDGLSEGSLSIAKVCERAGVGPPALYYHYGNKEGLVAAVVEAVGRSWLEQIERSIPAAGDFEVRIAAAVRAWRRFIEAPGAPVTLLVQVGIGLGRESPVIQSRLMAVYAAAHRAVCRQIEGTVGPIDGLGEIAETLMDLIEAAALRYQLDGDRKGLTRRLERAGRTLWVLIEAARR